MMNTFSCPREAELLDALERGFIGAELDAHASSCASCGEIRNVAKAFLHERANAFVEAPVPSSGTMLWRMHVRRRLEAQTTARRSLLIGQAVTLAVAIALVVAFFGGEVRHFIATLTVSTPLLLVLGTSLLVAPLVLGWAAIRQK
jgi:hypothetical protein